MRQSRFPLSFSFRCGYPSLNRPGPGERGRKAVSRATPPQPGGHVTFCSGTLWHTSTRSHGGRSRPHLSLREGSENPPFPSRFIVSDRSSPSRVRFAASRPGRLRVDPKDALLTRGKGGSGRGARSGVVSRIVGESRGSLAHDKGYYHSYCRGGGRAARNLSAIPAALSRSRGALSPVRP